MKNRNYVINFEEMDGGKDIQIKRLGSVTWSSFSFFIFGINKLLRVSYNVINL